MNEDIERDLAVMRRRWNANREKLRVILERIDPRGLRRPARDPEERRWLAQRGEPSVFIEDDECAAAARAYYARRYTRPES